MEEQKNKLFVGSLPWAVTSDKLKEVFSQFGDVTEAVVIADKFSGRSKGFGFVTFANDADAAKAVDGMNGKDLDGREIVVNVARPKKEE